MTESIESAASGEGAVSPSPSLGRIRRRLLALSFVDELGPLYAVYVLLFDDHGLSVSEISWAYISWAVLAFALEIPSGALADRFDRRGVVLMALGLRALGIAAWLVVPGYRGVMVGAVCWALHDALASGAWEALVYDEVEATGQPLQYGPIMARMHQARDVAFLVSAAAASSLLAVGWSLERLGWITAAAQLLPAAILISLRPSSGRLGAEGAPQAEDADPPGDGPTTWWEILRAGVRFALAQPQVGRLVVLGGLLEGAFVFDEYAHLLARDRGATDVFIPVLVVTLWVGRLLGSELAARRPDLDPRVVGAGLAVGGVLMALALRSSLLAGVAVLGAGYFIMETSWVLSDARMQAEIDAQIRATVTSVRGMCSAVVAGLLFALVGLASAADPGPGLSVAALVVAIAGAMAARWLPKARQGGPESTESPLGARPRAEEASEP